MSIDKEKLFAWLDKRIEQVTTKESHDEILQLKRLIVRGTFNPDPPKEEKCIACNGSGYYDSHNSPPCGSCNGTGVEQ